MGGVLTGQLLLAGNLNTNGANAGFCRGRFDRSSDLPRPTALHHHGYQHDRGFQPEALEIQSPSDHRQNNMPFILAGKAGGKLATKRWLKVPSQPHNNLLVSILNMFGIEHTRFGHSDYCTGPLSGLA